MGNEYLYRIQPTRLAMVTEGPTAHEANVVSQHFHYLQTLAAQNIVLLAGRTTTADIDTFGIVIFVADSEEAARAVVANDPAVREGVMTAELFPYHIAITSLIRPPLPGS